ncbi:cysteine hydrolase family protein [Haladaptatus sp. DJG-WS-42]|uniref:cysteine hydrolase family protein n=1 Tax=Haladaptatus sp. DJG-WS-42 TaxID=3120516 RepID=UPI0030CE6654
MTELSDNTALITIDVQAGFDDPAWGPRNNPDMEANLDTLLAAWREAGRPVFHVKHHSTEPDSPLRPDQPGSALREGLAAAGEPVITKNVNSAFIGTDLESRLKTEGITTLVLAGLTTDHCVSTTARMAENLGFTVYVVADATATHERTGYDGTAYDAAQSHALALAHLNGEFATVLDTATLLGVEAK